MWVLSFCPGAAQDVWLRFGWAHAWASPHMCSGKDKYLSRTNPWGSHRCFLCAWMWASMCWSQHSQRKQLLLWGSRAYSWVVCCCCEVWLKFSVFLIHTRETEPRLQHLLLFFRFSPTFKLNLSGKFLRCTKWRIWHFHSFIFIRYSRIVSSHCWPGHQSGRKRAPKMYQDYISNGKLSCVIKHQRKLICCSPVIKTGLFYCNETV